MTVSSQEKSIEKILKKLKSLMPAPFECCEIPAGKVTIMGKQGSYIDAGTSETFEIPAFYVAKYPVTNAQYTKFMEVGGYKNKKFWTKEGWEFCQSKAWTQPLYWGDSDFAGDDKPVAGVSWYEAMAFCNCLNRLVFSSRKADALKITLPTEAQWQRAAQDDDGRDYPWGNEFEVGKANVRELALDRTTPVNYYPDGASPYGVMGMSGNVWEWTLTELSSGKTSIEGHESRIRRGGSFFSFASLAALNARFHNSPHGRNLDYGFRICLNLSDTVN